MVLKKKKVFKEIINTYPYKDLKYSDFCEILSFVYDGGYILKITVNGQN